MNKCLKTHLIKLINFKKSGASYILLFKGHTGGHKIETQWEFVTNTRLPETCSWDFFKVHKFDKVCFKNF